MKKVLALLLTLALALAAFAAMAPAVTAARIVMDLIFPPDSLSLTLSHVRMLSGRMLEFYQKHPV